MPTDRINTWGIMKGLAIIGVVVGHIGFTSMDRFVNYWDLPAFYFVSGYFMKEKNVLNGRQFFVSRLRRMMLPWIIYVVLAFFMHNPLVRWGVIHGTLYHLPDFIHHPAWILHEGTRQELIGALWFVPSLFIIASISWVLARCSLRWNLSYGEWGGVIVSAVGFALASEHIGPLILVANLSICWLFLFGYTVRKHGLEKWLGNRSLSLVPGLILLAALLNRAHLGCQYDHAGTMPWYFPVVFIAGILLTYQGARCIERSNVKRYIAYIGDNSFSIMALHFSAFRLVTWFHGLFDSRVVLTSYITDKTDLLLWAPIYLVVGIGLPLLLARLYDYLLQRWKK